jgi:CBS domain-containing protein
MKRVDEIMTKNPAYCLPEMGLVDVAELMLKYDCGEIPVVYSRSEKKIMGVITDRDICIRAVALGLNPAAMNVEQFMSYPAIVVKSFTDINDCCQIMEDNQIKRLPVVDEDENLCGMISLADLCRNDENSLAAEVVKELSQPRIHHSPNKYLV